MPNKARILMVASEAAPLAKTGGLADVVGSLPPALRARGHEVAVLIPRYGGIPLDGARRVYDDLPVWLGTQHYPASIYEVVRKGVPYYMLECPALFDRLGLYGEKNLDYPDNHIRFAALSRAALEVARRMFRPNILHGHDWQAGLMMPYLHRVLNTDPTFYGMKNVFTIHNLGYQGVFAPAALEEVGLPAELRRPDLMEFHGDISYLKAGIVFADRITTVSPTYAREIQTPEHGFGMDGLLRARSAEVSGILNGIDDAEWNPAKDPVLAAHYTVEKLAGKRKCKAELLERFGLPADDMERRPLIGIISRFALQKGFDLIAEGIHEILEDGVVQMVVLGTGEPVYEKLFLEVARARPQQVGVRIGYDNAMAHRIEAGADMFLMPSHYEPCGLNQMYSMRYGTVPIGRATGGLDDTIDEETGFKFVHYNVEGLLWAVRAALDAWRNPETWARLMRNGMLRDFSWNASAAQYSALYQRITPGA